MKPLSDPFTLCRPPSIFTACTGKPKGLTRKAITRAMNSEQQDYEKKQQEYFLELRPTAKKSTYIIKGKEKVLKKYFNIRRKRLLSIPQRKTICLMTLRFRRSIFPKKSHLRRSPHRPKTSALRMSIWAKAAQRQNSA